MKDIEQPGQACLPGQATVTAHLDYSSSFLPGFSAPTPVRLCPVHPPLSSQRDPVKPKSNHILPLLISSLCPPSLTLLQRHWPL